MKKTKPKNNHRDGFSVQIGREEGEFCVSRENTFFSRKFVCRWIYVFSLLAVESRFRKKQVFEATSLLCILCFKNLKIKKDR